MPLNVDLTTEQKCKVTAAPKTQAGNPAALDGALDGDTISGDATVEPVPGEPLSVWVSAGALIGPSTVRIIGDADLGAGVVTLEDTVTVNVTGAMAANLGITAAPPTLK